MMQGVIHTAKQVTNLIWGNAVAIVPKLSLRHNLIRSGAPGHHHLPVIGRVSHRLCLLRVLAITIGTTGLPHLQLTGQAETVRYRLTQPSLPRVNQSPLSPLKQKHKVQLLGRPNILPSLLLLHQLLGQPKTPPKHRQPQIPLCLRAKMI